MINMNDVEDQTGKIRKLKHSKKIKEDIEVLQRLKPGISDYVRQILHSMSKFYLNSAIFFLQITQIYIIK